MTAIILDGRQVATSIQSKLKQRLSERAKSGIAPPTLAVILLGKDPASEIYVTNKRKACVEVGINSLAYDLPSSTSEESLLVLIDKLNQDANVHGILVQLPLPQHIDSNKIIQRISPYKDVDGFHPYNLGSLAQRVPLLRPCTPFGIIELLNAYHIPLKTKYAVVVGASNIVGRPMALELLLAGSTVTICHRFTKNLEAHVGMADIIVVATGVKDVVKTEWLNKEQTVVDVGMHRSEDGKLRGDVDFNSAKDIVSHITPVPGGVGPMTITALLQNTLHAETISQGHPSQIHHPTHQFLP